MSAAAEPNTPRRPARSGEREAEWRSHEGTAVLRASAASPGPPVPLPRWLLCVARGRNPVGARCSIPHAPSPDGQTVPRPLPAQGTWVFPAGPVPLPPSAQREQALCQQELEAPRTSPHAEEEVAVRTEAAEKGGRSQFSPKNGSGDLGDSSVIVCYGLDCVPPNPYVETPLPSVTGACVEVIKVQ